MEDREEIARMIAAGFQEAGDKVKAGGASDLEVGRAMVATGLSFWAKAVKPEELVDQLAHLMAGIAIATNVDLSGDEASAGVPRILN